jgi:serine/threonine protein phosphatase PrpC
LILAVADGHGSARHFRSEIGADLATRAAIDVLREFAEHQPNDRELSMIVERLPAAIERRWKEAVQEHLTTNPVEEGDDQRLANLNVDSTQYIAYGTTLLSVLVTRHFIVYLQLGDGDILAVSAAGNVERVIRRDPALIANETTSLCLPQARRHFRTQFQTIAGSPPSLLMLCTDGYANSFEEADFLKIGSDYLGLIQTNGIEHVRERLEEWLWETTQKGSGDDITVGIVAAPSLYVDGKGEGLLPQHDEETCVAATKADELETSVVEQPSVKLSTGIKTSKLLFHRLFRP